MVFYQTFRMQQNLFILILIIINIFRFSYKYKRNPTLFIFFDLFRNI